jgi:hypothetical protein
MYCCSPSSWEVQGHFLNALIVQQKRCTFTTLENIFYTASSTYTVHKVYKALCHNGDNWKGKVNRRSKGKNKMQMASLPSPNCP